MRCCCLLILSSTHLIHWKLRSREKIKPRFALMKHIWRWLWVLEYWSKSWSDIQKTFVLERFWCFYYIYICWMKNLIISKNLFCGDIRPILCGEVWARVEPTLYKRTRLYLQLTFYFDNWEREVFWILLTVWRSGLRL